MGKWRKKKLSKIVTITKGQQINRVVLEKEGDYYVLNGGQTPSGYTNKWNTMENTISISEGGNSCGYVAFNKEKFWSGGHNYTLKNVTQEINIQYLYQYLKYQQPQIMLLRVGSGLPNVQKKELSKVDVDYACNIKEQEKIAEILATIDDTIEKTTQIIEKYKAIKEGMMQDLLSNGIDEKGNIRSPKTHKYKNSSLGMIPEEWEVLRIEDLFKLRARIGWQGLRSDEFQEEGPYLVTGVDFDDGEIDWDSCYHVSEMRFHQDKGIQLKDGDLLITKDGTIGKTAIVNNCPKDVTLNSGVFVVRPINKLATTEYLYYLLNNRSFELFMANNLTGSTIKHLNQGILYKMDIRIPKREEQERICVVLKSIDQKLKKEKIQIEKYIKIKQALMQDLLTHKVAVDILL